jgi:hypothetical protein
MSIQDVNLKRLQHLKNKLNNSHDGYFQFSENMKAIFHSKQDFSKSKHASVQSCIYIYKK